MTRTAWLGLLLVACVGDVASPSVLDAGAADTAHPADATATDAADAGYPDDPNLRYVFVTSGTFAPGKDFDGVSRADDLCTQIAGQAGIPGKYKAWMSDLNNSPSTRFTQSAKPYVLLDGTVIAADWASLTNPNNSLKHRIDRNEHNQTLPIGGTNASCPQVGSPMAWTCTDNDGTRSTKPNDCAEWTATTSASFGISGSSGTGNSPGWSNDEAACTPTCDTKNAFYCFEQ